ncbi:MAG: glutamine synthetase family protein [Deltaproteobacteria bacterium]|nr:glutamine synthetase family protein [Deltaproteobacteria bacterium]
MEAGSELDRWLREAQVRFLRLGWVDSAGVLRTQAVSAARAAAMSAEGLGVVSGVQALPVFADAVQPGLGIGAIGQVWLRPDLDTLRIVPWQPTHAATLGAFVSRDGSPWPFCPRSALRRAVARLAGAGFALQAAFEHEFMLLRRGAAGLEHLENSHYASAHGLNHAGAVLDDIAAALEAQGVPVRAMLKEAGLSQFELSTEHGAPLLAADRFVVVRETINAVAAQHDLLGTCLPLVFADEAGSGWHIHFSLWRDGANLTGAGDGLGAEARAFVSGIHAHLPALLALSTPTPNSFRRLRPGAWAGVYRVWGYDHKEAPLRVPTERQGAPTNVELKASDASANPYLSLTGLIAAGLDGIARGLDLPPPVDFDPGQLSDAERAARGIVRLPASLDDALAALEHDPVLLAALGEPLARAYLAVKRAESRELGGLALADEVARLVEAY